MNRKEKKNKMFGTLEQFFGPFYGAKMCSIITIFTASKPAEISILAQVGLDKLLSLEYAFSVF